MWRREVLAELREHCITAKDVPVYLVQYFRAHVERSGGGVDALSELVSVEWLTAWSSLDKGSFTGFLGDVRRIWLAAEKADAESTRAGDRAQFLDLEIRCALCLSSVISMAADIPTAFLNALVRRGVWTPAQALAYASNKPIPRLRVEAARTRGRRARRTARPIPAQPVRSANGAGRRRTGSAVGERSEWLEEPLAALRHVADRTLRLRLVAVHAAIRPVRQVDVVVRALEEASTEPDLRQRLRWVQAFGTHLPEPHRTRAAEMTLQALEACLDSGVAVANVLDDVTSIPAALVDRCIAQIDRLPTTEGMIRLGRLVAVTSADAQDRVLDAALEAIRFSSSGEQRLTCVRALLKAFPDDRLDAIDSIVDLFERDDQRARARIAIVRCATGARRDRRFAQLLEDLGRWPDDHSRVSLLSELAPELLQKQPHRTGCGAARARARCFCRGTARAMANVGMGFEELAKP